MQILGRVESARSRNSHLASRRLGHLQLSQHLFYSREWMPLSTDVLVEVSQVYTDSHRIIRLRHNHHPHTPLSGFTHPGDDSQLLHSRELGLHLLHEWNHNSSCILLKSFCHNLCFHYYPLFFFDCATGHEHTVSYSVRQTIAH